MAIGTRYGVREVDFLESFQWDCRLGSFRAELAPNHVTIGKKNAAEVQLLQFSPEANWAGILQGEKLVTIRTMELDDLVT